MQLIKFCNSEHNINSGAGLRVGTLFQYRTIENSELRDGEEGNFEFVINFPEEIELDRQTKSTISRGSSFWRR